MLESAPKYQFPWRAGTRFELLIDGSSFFPRMPEAVEATRFIWIEIYLFESGEVTEERESLSWREQLRQILQR